ncbi:MAG: cytochrome c [Anaerolineae bacterium]|nr:cytochrome c [Anaerolineae bacterium]
MKNSLLKIIGIIIVLTVCLIAEVVTMKGQPVAPLAQPAKSEAPAADNPINGNDSGDSGVEKVVDNTAKGDAARGKKLFSTFQPVAGMACNACHRVDSEKRLVGPGLFNVSIRAAHRVDGLSAEAYIRQSIIDPGAYVVDGYQNIMPKTFRKAFTDAQLDDLIAYLTSLK